MPVSYRGTAMAIQNVISGQLPMMVADTDGNVRTLAVLSSTRIAQLPEVPALAESGVPKFEADL